MKVFKLSKAGDGGELTRQLTVELYDPTFNGPAVGVSAHLVDPRTEWAIATTYLFRTSEELRLLATALLEVAGELDQAKQRYAAQAKMADSVEEERK